MAASIYPPHTRNEYESSFAIYTQDPGTRPYLHDEREPLKKSAQPSQPSNAAGRPRPFKVTLHSAHRAAGSTLQSAAYSVRLPAEFTRRSGARLAITVESFIMAAGPNAYANVDAYPYQIALKELASPLVFSTPAQQAAGILATSVGRNYYGSVPRDWTNGVACVDPTLFDRPVTVLLTSPYFDTAAAGGISNEYTLTLVVYDDAV